MPAGLDVRSWNLFVGVTLTASGCASRPFSLDGGDGESTDTTTSNTTVSMTTVSTSMSTVTTVTTVTTDPPECQYDSDCPPGYYCIDGACQYAIAPDGSQWYECYTSLDCQPLEVCRYNDCEATMNPAACGSAVGQPILLPLAAQTLALSFANVDQSGGEELVVAGDTQLFVYTSGSMVASASPRGIASPQILDMAAGELDGQPGDDIMILPAGNQLLLHGSDGMSGFNPAIEQLHLLSNARGLIVGPVDGGGIDGVLAWGNDGATLQVDGQSQQLLPGPMMGATYRGPASGSPGFSLREPYQLAFFDLGGALEVIVPAESNPLGEAELIDSLASFVTFGEPIDVDISMMESFPSWTLLSAYRTNPPELAAVWGIQPLATEIAGADLTGDGNGDLVLLAQGELWIFRDVDHLPGSCLVMAEVGGPVAEFAIGDHDGDGDDEIAIRLQNGPVALLDDEG